ncbi:hypothetical protein ANN_04846 [Periplaneta americana]|uniref:Uncharacterized protein n=1 Tax=Periplaneta americana TaxID=6978 RepID=A0ABQ8TAS2_PERAM|nr:hypothetical protein ANN_04846 [Periplaneta americana]
MSMGLECSRLFLGLFTIFTAVFDIYCLAQAAPGSTHYTLHYQGFEFVYVEMSMVKEYEKKMVPWLYCFAAFTLFRLFAFVFGSIVNDMIFGYNIAMCLLWIIYTVASVYGWLLVYSLYLELSDLTRLEDFAHLRVSLKFTACNIWIILHVHNLV